MSVTPRVSNWTNADAAGSMLGQQAVRLEAGALRDAPLGIKMLAVPAPILRSEVGDPHR